jgi:autotransporter-associated beta strand protein
MNGGTLTLATNLTYDAAASNLALIDGAIDLGATDRIFIVNNNASADPDLEISAPIGGTGGLIKQGAGTLLLSGDNGYLGRTRIDHGVIRMGHLNALGDTTNPTRIEGIAQAAYLDFNGLGTAGNPITEPLELVYNNTDYIGNTSTNPAYHNAAISVNSRGMVFGSGTITLAGAITNTGTLFMQNNGSLILECATNPTIAFLMGGNSSLLLPNHRLKVNTAAAMPSGITIQQGVLDLTAVDTQLRVTGQIYFHPNIANTVGSLDTGNRKLTLDNNAKIDVKDQTAVAVGGPFVVSGNISLGTNTASWKLGRSNPDMTNTLVCPYDFDLLANVSAETSGVGITFDSTYAENPGIVRMTGSNTFSGTLTINKGQTVMFTSIGNAGAGASALGNPVTAANSLYIGSGTVAGKKPTFRYIGTEPAGHSSNRSIYNDGNTDASLQIIADGVGPLSLNPGGTSVTFTSRGTVGVKTLVLAGSNTGSNMLGAVLAAIPGQVALAKEGPGTWILNSRLSSYTNLTTIRGGKLLVNGVLGNTVSGVICTNGGTLGGTGAVYRPVLVAAGSDTNAGGRVAPGMSAGTLIVGDGATPRSLTFETSDNETNRPAWDVELGAADCDMIVVNGDFVMPATGQVTLTVTNADAMSPRYKTYVLMTWTGADPAGDASQFALNLLPANWRGGTVTVDKTANEVRLSGITQPAGTLIMVQ